jgi:hypothetical protein
MGGLLLAATTMQAQTVSKVNQIAYTAFGVLIHHPRLTTTGLYTLIFENQRDQKG